MLKISRKWARVEVHPSDDQAPNIKPVLKFFDCRKPGQPQIAEIELDDFCGMAQALYTGELLNNLKLDRNSKTFKRLLKRGRKGLGYSYP